MIVEYPEEKLKLELQRELVVMEEKLVLMHYMLTTDNMDKEKFNIWFNHIIDTANNYNINYTRIKITNSSNNKINWKYVQSTDNCNDKYLFAKKVYSKIYSRYIFLRNNSRKINLLISLGDSLERVTNIRNFYFNLTKEELLKKVFKRSYKNFNVMFKEDIKALALDYRKFYDINRFSETSYIDNDSTVRITQEQGFELVEIGNLICNNKLEEASDTLYRDVVPNVKGIPWLE